MVSLIERCPDYRRQVELEMTMLGVKSGFLNPLATVLILILYAPG
jgi:hypothetical protein